MERLDSGRQTERRIWTVFCRGWKGAKHKLLEIEGCGEECSSMLGGKIINDNNEPLLIHA